jgi:hypothetical protein
MCPICIATAAATIAALTAGGASAGGATALLVRKLRAASAAPTGPTSTPNPTVTGGTDDKSDDRPAR